MKKAFCDYCNIEITSTNNGNQTVAPKNELKLEVLVYPQGSPLVRGDVCKPCLLKLVTDFVNGGNNG